MEAAEETEMGPVRRGPAGGLAACPAAPGGPAPRAAPLTALPRPSICPQCQQVLSKQEGRTSRLRSGTEWGLSSRWAGALQIPRHCCVPGGLGA